MKIVKICDNLLQNDARSCTHFDVDAVDYSGQI